MNINVNDNAFWICFWIIVAIVVISTSFVEKFDNSIKQGQIQNQDPIAQRIRAIENASIYQTDRARLIEQLIRSEINTNSEIILEKK